MTGNLAEALALSDRIRVMFNGAVAEIIEQDDTEGSERIPKMLAGG